LTLLHNNSQNYGQQLIEIVRKLLVSAAFDKAKHFCLNSIHTLVNAEARLHVTVMRMLICMKSANDTPAEIKAPQLL
jgi:hypothetical protein